MEDRADTAIYTDSAEHRATPPGWFQHAQTYPTARRTKLSIQQTTARIFGRRFTGSQAYRVVVLCYHSVHPRKRFATPPATFEAHLQWLKANCEHIRFSQAVHALSRVKPKMPAVAITFDDGYRDNFEYAFPLLKKYGFSATFFVTTGFIEHDPAVLSRFRLIRRSTADDICPLSWMQLREMTSAGMDVGAHTYSHPKLAVLGREQAWAELAISKRLMEERLGKDVTLMAYPYGKPQRDWNRRILELTAEAGYTSAAAVLFRNVRYRDCSLAVPRIAVANETIETLRDKVHGAWDFVGIWQENCPIWLARVTSPRDFRPVPGFDAEFEYQQSSGQLLERGTTARQPEHR